MRLKRVFLDQDLRCSFEGLRKIADDADTPVKNATVVFINRKMTCFKLLHDDTYLVYYKNGNRRIPIDALVHLPDSFGGSQLDMTNAIKTSLESKLIRSQR